MGSACTTTGGSIRPFMKSIKASMMVTSLPLKNLQHNFVPQESPQLSACPCVAGNQQILCARFSSQQSGYIFFNSLSLLSFVEAKKGGDARTLLCSGPCCFGCPSPASHRTLDGIAVQIMGKGSWHMGNLTPFLQTGG